MNRPLALVTLLLCAGGALGAETNLALVAKPTTSFVSGHETLAAVHDGFTPAHSDDKRHGAYGNWPQSGLQWVEYEWTQPVSANKIDVYWFDDHRGVRLPTACRLKYWDGSALVEVKGAKGLGLAANRFNATTFDEVRTTRLRLEFDSDGKSSTGVLEWRVHDSGASPNFPPTVEAGVDRVVVVNCQTWLDGRVRDDGKPSGRAKLQWSKESGPGAATFGDAASAATDAKFSAPGKYVVKLAADDGESTAADTLEVIVDPLPPAEALRMVWTTPYRVTSPFWRPRLRALAINWIPHCIRQIEDPQVREGGIANFVEAGKKLAGKPHAGHVGAPFSNTWVYNTLESICLALMLDPEGDPELAAAQAALRKTMDDWIPKMLSAQEPDGYLHTQYTLQGHKRWTNKHDHEGYQAGYFIEAALAHYLLTGGKDARLYDAARRLADCWCANVGPAPKRAWYEGHQELEQALVRLARFVDRREGEGKGRKYVELSRFLQDSRRDGDEYDQSHLPVTRQYEAVGHAVRALYGYTGMADIAVEDRDLDYHSAVKSLWHSVVNRKYYVTGGVGSGETSEGFGKEFSLPNHAYCESCAGCGELFFQHRLQMAYQQSRYADLYEESLYNAVLGGVDLDGRNFTYTNPLDAAGARYKWHVCPCCVGNIPRTLLALPTWTYTKSGDMLCVNLFVGSKVAVGKVNGTEVEMVQTTDYPWSGKVAIAVNPAVETEFWVALRVPSRKVSDLYTNAPEYGGVKSLAVNGAPAPVKMENGYAGLKRRWKRGDTIEVEFPMQVQRIKADPRIAATAGRTALRYGPLLYNIESVDQKVDGALDPAAPLSVQWRPDLLGGVMAIRGKFGDGSDLLAIPNYARLNRGGRSIVWIRDLGVGADRAQ